MQSPKYIWRNVTRNVLRTILTVLSIGCCVAIMTVMCGYIVTQESWGKQAEGHNRIVVMNIQGFSGELPIRVVDKVRQVDGVRAAVPYSWFGGNYEGERAVFAQFATDPMEVFNVWPEFEIDSGQLAAWQANRQGCVADRELAEQMGWEIGQRIPLEGTFQPFDPDLMLVGLYDAPTFTGSIWFHWDYINEGLKQNNARGTDNSGTIFAKISSADAIPGVIQTIDDHYASSTNPTRTQTEAAFAQMFSDMVGGIRKLLLLVGLAVVFALTLVAATTMAMSMRERTTEIAVLKAIGFPRAQIIRMVVGEACLIALLGGVVGVGMGCLVVEGAHVGLPQLFPFGLSDTAGLWLVGMVAIAGGVGFASGIIPAIHAAQLSVVDGLRRVV